MPSIILNREELLKHIRAHRKYGSTDHVTICAYSNVVFFRTYKDNKLSLSTALAKPYFVKSDFVQPYFYKWKDFVNAVMDQLDEKVLIRQVGNCVTIGNATFYAVSAEPDGEKYMQDRTIPLNVLARILKPAKSAKRMSKASTRICGQDAAYISRIGDEKQIVVSHAFSKT